MDDADVAQLDPQARAFIEEVEAAGVPPLQTMSPAEIRMLQAAFVPRLSGQLEAVERVEDREISGPGGTIALRTYVPHAPQGILLWVHGGGWTIGSIETADAACRALARRTPCSVVSVGYRLAPEHKFPAAFEDVRAAARWVAANAEALGADATRIAIGGDSSGGALAAAATLDARDGGGPRFCYQVLVYPVSDNDMTRPSYREFGAGYLITIDEIRWYLKNYLRSPEDAENPLVCPLRAASLRGLPPALVVLAGCDPLRDDGEAYAARLRAEGVPVQVLRYDGMIHGFFTMPGVLDRAGVAYDAVARSLRHGFSRTAREDSAFEPGVAV